MRPRIKKKNKKKELVWCNPRQTENQSETSLEYETLLHKSKSRNKIRKTQKCFRILAWTKFSAHDPKTQAAKEKLTNETVLHENLWGG